MMKKTIFLPMVRKDNLLALLNGVELPIYSIDNSRFYFLEENENEDWELKAIPIH
jgi:hypothetical protein